MHALRSIEIKARTEWDSARFLSFLPFRFADAVAVGSPSGGDLGYVRELRGQVGVLELRPSDEAPKLNESTPGRRGKYFGQLRRRCCFVIELS